MDGWITLESFFWKVLYCITLSHSHNCLSFFLQVHPKDLNNGIINAGFLLLFKDLIKLFASYNDGIINLLGAWRFNETSTLLCDVSSPKSFIQRLINGRSFFLFIYLFNAEKYFKMKKSDCKESLEIYKKFLTRVTKISEFMKIAEVWKKCFDVWENSWNVCYYVTVPFVSIKIFPFSKSAWTKMTFLTYLM